MMSVVMDIGPNKIVELHVADAARSQVPGAIYEAVYRADGSAEQFFLSCGIEALTGYPPQAFVANRSLFASLIHVDDYERYVIEAERCRGKDAEFTWEGRIWRAQGDIRCIQVLSRRTQLSDGSGKWHGVMMDVSSRKAHEDELATLNEYFSMLLDKGPCVFYVREATPPPIGSSMRARTHTSGLSSIMKSRRRDRSKMKSTSILTTTRFR